MNQQQLAKQIRLNVLFHCLLVLVLLVAGQQQVSCQAARDDVTVPLSSYAMSPFNLLLPNTVKGIGSDLNSAQESVLAAVSGASLESVNEMIKNMQDATSNRYQAMDNMFNRFIAELAGRMKPEVMCRQYLAETKNVMNIAGEQAASLLSHTTSGANQISQGASSFLSKLG